MREKPVARVSVWWWLEAPLVQIGAAALLSVYPRVYLWLHTYLRTMECGVNKNIVSCEA